MIVLYKCDNFLWAERKKNIATTLYVCENSILYLSVQTEKSLQSALPSPPLPSPQDGWLSNDPFREILLRMTRKPRPHQFIGLMGKRSMGKSSSSQKSPHVSFPSADLLLNAVLSVLPQQMHRSPTKVSIISHSLI